MRSTPPLTLLAGPLELGVVVLVRVPFMDQIELYNHLTDWFGLLWFGFMAYQPF